VIRGRPVSSLEHWDAAHGLTINSRPPRGRVGVLTGHIGRCRPTDVDRELSFLILKLDGAGWMAPEILAAPTMSKESTMTTQTGTQGGHEFVPAEHTPADGDAPRRALALAQIRWRSTNLAVSKQRFLAESVQLIADALEVPLVKVLELERSGKWLVVRAGVGWSAGIVGRAKVPVGTTSHAGLTIRMDTPVIYDDLPHLAWFSESEVLRRQHVVSGMSAVIGAAGRPVGVLTVHHTRRRTFTPAEAKFLLRAAALISEGAAARDLQDPPGPESATSQDGGAPQHQLPLGLTRRPQ
jgi:hypothetical protein